MSDIVYCEAEAQDDPRFQYAESTFDPPPGVWAPACGHDACVVDDQHCTSSDGWHDWDCPVATCRWDTARKTCDFPKGHAGDHSYALHELPVLWPKPACPAWYAMLEAAQNPAPPATVEVLPS